MGSSVVVSRILVALLVALLLPIPVLSLATPAGIIYKAGDWIRYKYVLKGKGIAGSVSCEWTIEVSIEEVNGLHVKYSIKEKPTSGDQLCSALDPLGILGLMEGEVSDDLSSPHGFFLVNPNTTRTYVYHYTYENLTYTYYKGVLVNCSVSSITPFVSTGQFDISLVDTSIGELRGTPTVLSIAEGLLVIVVVISLVLFWVKRRRMAHPPPPPKS
jgi:hypothetical protein